MAGSSKSFSSVSSSSASSSGSSSSYSSSGSESSDPDGGGGNGGGGGGGSDDSSADPCDVDWSFSTSGTSSAWTEHTDHDIEFRVEDSTQCSGSSSGNSNRQIGTASATIEVPAGKTVQITWEMSAVVEREHAGFDQATFDVGGANESGLQSTDTGNGCSTETKTSNGTLNLAAGNHNLEVKFDTVDENYHTSAVGVRFKITSCSVS